MKKLFLILIIIILQSLQVNAYNENIFIQSALPETQLNNPLNLNYEFNLLNNPNYSFSSYYLPSKFGINELNTLGMLISLPLFENSIVSFIAEGFGNNQFQQSLLNINFAKDFDGQFSLKAGLILDNFIIYNYNSYQKIFLNLGAKIPIFSFFNIGFAFNNINRAYYVKDDFINQTGTLTLGFKIIDNFFIDINNYLKLGENYSIGIASSYEILNTIKARVCLANKPFRYELGSQLNISEFTSIGLGYSYNYNLGYVSYYFLTINL